MNRWKIPEWLEREVRARDQQCVYCRIVLLDRPPPRGALQAVGTWEHIVNDACIVTRENIARCCAPCNSSKGTKPLAVWLESTYCVRRGIREETVAPIVRAALRAGSYPARTKFAVVSPESSPAAYAQSRYAARRSTSGRATPRTT